MKYNIVKSSGFVAFGRDLVSLDAILFNLTKDLILVAPSINEAPIEKAQKAFGVYDKEMIKEAEMKIRPWLLAMSS